MTKKGVIQVKQIRGSIGSVQAQIATLKGLGLNKINKVSTLQDTAAVRGMIQKVKHLVAVL
ncbi:MULTISPECIES: 50S ribosomal protein L30 [unclassified Candidatus Lariskella]|uniref:50S ribosomal protein L30 n=1 Tax=unclassified Candidatus Lariskella TaxID=2632605 RepID=UPI0030CFF9E5